MENTNEQTTEQTTEQKDPWSNETFQAEQNYDQVVTKDHFIYVKMPNHYNRVMIPIVIFLTLLFLVDVYNTYTHQDRTVINTLQEGFTELYDTITEK